MARSSWAGAVFVLILGTATPAWANAGTPLMWAGLLHLTLGNAVIGVLEAAVLGALFSTPGVRTVVAMIAANYASAWLGGVILAQTLVSRLQLDLCNAWSWLWGMVGITWVLTLVIEWPFVAWCLRGTQRWLVKSLWGSLAIQSASYLLLLVFYAMASGVSLYTRATVVAADALPLPEEVRVFYIGSADGAVYSRTLALEPPQRVHDPHATNSDDRLLVRRDRSDTNRWELVALLTSEDRTEPKLVVLRTNMAVQAAPDRRVAELDPPQYDDTTFNFGAGPRLGRAAASSWQCRTGFWPIEGLMATNVQTGQSLHLSLETPFIAWTFRNAVHLPNDIVLFQLGDDQICALDLNAKRVALLWRGRGPVAVIEGRE